MYNYKRDLLQQLGTLQVAVPTIHTGTAPPPPATSAKTVGPALWAAGTGALWMRECNFVCVLYMEMTSTGTSACSFALCNYVWYCTVATDDAFLYGGRSRVSRHLVF
jgi:hypothetical protein